MYIHAYLSKHEVIGMLAGQIYDTNILIRGTNDTVKYIIISRIYPTESCTDLRDRRQNCEISPIE